MHVPELLDALRVLDIALHVPQPLLMSFQHIRERFGRNLVFERLALAAAELRKPRRVGRLLRPPPELSQPWRLPPQPDVPTSSDTAARSANPPDRRRLLMMYPREMMPRIEGESEPAEKPATRVKIRPSAHA